MSDKLAKVDSFAALVPVDGPAGLFSQDEVMSDNIGVGGVSPSQLDRVKVPSGGGTAWEIPTLDGKGDVAKELDVIIVAARDVRSYYDTKYTGGNEPPVCHSLDCVTGVGEPGGNCEDCPFSQWESATDDDGNPTNGQACNQRKLMLCIAKDSALPFVISAPPTSLKSVGTYFLRLAGQMLPHWGVVTKLVLEKGKSGGGIDYSVIAPSYVRTLTPEEVPAIRQYRKNLLPMFNLISAEQAEADVEDAEFEETE